MTERDRKQALAAVGGLVLVGAVLRLSGLGERGFWYDELRTLLASRLDLIPMVGERLTAGHPPVFFLLTWSLLRLLGESEVLLRLPAALGGIGAIPASYLLTARLGAGRAAALLAAALVACNPLQIELSRVARPYSLVVLVSLLSSALLARSDGEPAERGHGAVLFAALTLLGLGLHASAFLVLVAQLLFLLVRKEPRWPPAAAGASVAAAVAAAGAFAGRFVEPGAPLNWVPPFSWRTLLVLPDTLLLDLRLSGGGAWSRALLGATLLGVLILAVAGGRTRREGVRTRLLAWLALGPILLVLPSSLADLDLLQVPRYFATSGVAVLVLAACGVTAVGAGWARTGVAVLLVLASLFGCFLQIRHPQLIDWRAVARIVEHHRRSGDEVVLLARFPGQRVVVEHYLGEEVTLLSPPGVVSAGDSAPSEGAPGIWLAAAPERLAELEGSGSKATAPLLARYSYRRGHDVSPGALLYLWGRKP